MLLLSETMLLGFGAGYSTTRRSQLMRHKQPSITTDVHALVCCMIYPASKRGWFLSRGIVDFGVSKSAYEIL